MSRKLLAVLLCFALICCMPAAAANLIVEAPDPVVFSSLLEDGSPYRVLLLADDLSDLNNAERVVHNSATGAYVLEYKTAVEAENALRDIQARYGSNLCWTDFPEDGASVLGEKEPAREFRSWGANALELDEVYGDDRIGEHLKQENITVAVLDTGLDPESTFWKNRTISTLSYDFVNSTSQLSDVYSGPAAGHGTMVVSVLDDLLPENAELMILRVFDDTGSASRTTVLTALGYAVENGADIINLSLGWEGADSSFAFLNDTLEKAHDEGIAVICASGNKGANANTCYPASYKTTISVSAVDRDNNHPSYSNFGETVDLTAPGKDVRTIGLKDRPMVSKGTSFAAPHITAVAASLLTLNRDLTDDQLLDALKDCAKDLGEEGWDPYYGWGIPQMKAAAESALIHEWDQGEITVQPTTDAEGMKTFTCGVCGETRTEAVPVIEPSPEPTDMPEPINPFEDVGTAAYYYTPVLWAVSHSPQITNGVDASHFAPASVCTRAQVVTFLWRAMGQPEPQSTANPFSDVKQSDYYYKAVLWASQQGITSGTAKDQFSPGSPCTRAHVVTFLWRAENQPKGTNSIPFADVSPEMYYSDAVSWAVNHSPKITEGTDSTRFSPNQPCTRGQIVTFLYRDLAS